MKVISDIIEIPKIEDFDNYYIEDELSKRGIDPIRWAIVEVSEKLILISVSYNT